MTSSLAIKATASLGVLGAVGGGIALYKSSVLKTKTTLGTLIQKDKWTLLTSSHTSHISKILEAYKKNSPSKPTLLFNGFTGTETDASTKLLEKLKLPALLEKAKMHTKKILKSLYQKRKVDVSLLQQ